MKKLLALAIFALSSFAGVTYEFKGSRLQDPDAFTDATATLTLPGYATTRTDYLPGANLVCSVCNHVEMIPDAVAAGFTITPSSVVAYGVDGTGSTFFFYFEPSAFTTIGVHSSIILTGLHEGTLTVTSTIPEPSTFGLLAAGLGFAAFRLRRR